MTERGLAHREFQTLPTISGVAHRFESFGKKISEEMLEKMRKHKARKALRNGVDKKLKLPSGSTVTLHYDVNPTFHRDTQWLSSGSLMWVTDTKRVIYTFGRSLYDDGRYYHDIDEHVVYGDPKVKGRKWASERRLGDAHLKELFSLNTLITATRQAYQRSLKPKK